MTDAVFTEVIVCGGTLYPRPDGRLGYWLPDAAVNAGVLERVREARDEILEIFRRVELVRQTVAHWHDERREAFDERVAIMEIDGEVPGPVAELAAFYAYVVDVDRAALRLAVTLSGRILPADRVRIVDPKQGGNNEETTSTLPEYVASGAENPSRPDPLARRGGED